MAAGWGCPKNMVDSFDLLLQRAFSTQLWELRQKLVEALIITLHPRSKASSGKLPKLGLFGVQTKSKALCSCCFLMIFVVVSLAVLQWFVVCSGLKVGLKTCFNPASLNSFHFPNRESVEATACTSAHGECQALTRFSSRRGNLACCCSYYMYYYHHILLLLLLLLLLFLLQLASGTSQKHY